MNTKVDHALIRLNRILPLKQRQDECGRQIKELHRQVLRSFATMGRIPTKGEMAQYEGNLEDALEVLRKSELVTFSEEGDPVGAYPFTTEVRQHIVRINGHRVYAMCALDALAVSPMFGTNVQIASRCRITGDSLDIHQSGKKIENPDQAGDIHLGIAWGAADAGSRCADSLCMEMLFLRTGKIARQWLAQDPGSREVFTLPEAVEFADRFFAPLVS